MAKNKTPSTELEFDSGGPKDSAYEAGSVEPPAKEVSSPEEFDSQRPETGPMRFGEDWPGTFIRGDESFHYRLQLEAALEYAAMGTAPDEMVLTAIRNLLALLTSSESGHGTPVLLKTFTSCRS